MCVLVSGGLDSAVLVGRLIASGRTVLPLYLRCGFRWEAAEVQWLRRFLKAVRSSRILPLEVVDLPLQSTYGAHWSFGVGRVPGARSHDRAVFLPGRNVLLLTHAAILCAKRGITTITLGLLKGNPFGDATQRFLTLIGRCLSEALDHPIRILTPLRTESKRNLIRSAGVPIALTFSCLQPRGVRHCGRCNKCAERMRAFREAGVQDPTVYAT